LAFVKTKLESGRAVAGVSGEREPAKGNQQALRGHRIGNDDAEKRPPEAL
jgi:hypothetical protein